MAQMRISRNAATPKGFLRRISDARFERVDDPRAQQWVVHPLHALLKLGALAFSTHARSVRAVEVRSEQLRPTVRAQVGLKERVSDNAFGLVLPRIKWPQLRRCLHRQVKAEWRRGRLVPVRLQKSTAAIDGKHVATVPEKRLRALVTQRTSLDGATLAPAELRQVLSTQFPHVQLQESSHGKLCGLIRVHRTTLISSSAAVALDQWPIAGQTNEWGAIELTVSALMSAYGRTKLIERVTLDAGNATPEVAQMLQGRDIDYLMSLKVGQGRLWEHAVDTLGDREGRQADHRDVVEERGKTICYSVWREKLDGEYGFEGARQVVRIERVVAGDEDAEVGNRYFVSSESPDELGAKEALALARAHWRCENEGHWTADAIFDEDARRTPWTMHPDGVLVAGLLRSIAINILAVLRALTRNKSAEKWHKPTWKMVVEQALMTLCIPILDTTEFDAFEA
ncbi:ISAs1 family transposase [Persicimonas caeni]|uniref:ISAs1 family transposase n=1 Tax=Persicimonas caeni TaxID=2292766 RepID=A0A4Y6PYJ5_PERCE|nr:ISAs1 family transposase [Persicimonas caeni]QDG53158.1 ISAs1 family transposase [Persicimonas caeni]QDG53386.1 ISAs1 family transposase [Persicimonas caeni]QED34380.1 ISAs1 family transposase [Persicimonas caeni]QED34607.1 ISAs1 family transposase [Persicimonas caeni]